MRVHLIKKESIENFAKRNSQSRIPLTKWLSIIKQANWNIPNDIKESFGSADILGNNSKRVVFNIGGNKYRVICTYFFGGIKVHLFIKWIGSHAEYSKLCNSEKQYTVNFF
ncbi:MAG: type II toxin-antitoxin system HigB family toxin [Bacteroidetes bacterium]|nr:MAG: type II toxin-antitoxin system HigB family toxin [Bacteroidota bacterium]